METVTVNATALRRVLIALVGPPHYVRELQATMGPLPLIGQDNPINILLSEYNAALQAHREPFSAIEQG